MKNTSQNRNSNNGDSWLLTYKSRLHSSTGFERYRLFATVENFLPLRANRVSRYFRSFVLRRGLLETAEFFPNLFLIGSDGGGEAYAFDVSENEPTVFEVPFIGMSSDARAIASSFDSFVAAPHSGSSIGQ